MHRAKLAIVFALLKALLGALLAAMKPRASLVAENLALRQQLAVLRRATPRPRLRPIDQAFWPCSRRHGRAGPTCSQL
jgi:hypothetical protein